MSLKTPKPTTLQACAITLTGFSSIAWLPVIGAAYARFASVLLSAAVWLLVWAAGGLERLDRSRRTLTAFLAVASFVVVLSGVRSRFPGIALTYGGPTSVSAAYWIALLVIVGASARVTLSSTTLKALKLQFLWVLPVAIVGSIEKLLTGRVTFGFRNADYFAPMMVLMLPVALAFAVQPGATRSGWWRVGAAALAVSILIAGTVSGYIGLAVTVLFMAIFAPSLMGVSELLRRGILVSLATALALFVAAGAMYVTDAVPDAVRPFLERNVLGASAATRLEMWRVAGIEISENLLTGIGPDQYAFEGQRLFSKRLFLLEHDAQPDAALPVDPHSAIMLIPLEFGLLGLGTFAALALTWAFQVLRSPFKTAEGFNLRWAFALGALGFGYATIFTPFPLLFGGMPLMLTGLAVVRPPDPRPWPEVKRFAKPRWLVASVATLVAALIAGSAVGGWYIFMKSRSVLDSSSGPAQASRLQPHVAYYRYARLWQEGRLLSRARDAGAQRRYQRAVDSAPQEIRGYAPYLVELVRLSIEAAMDSGRTDLSWEIDRLERAIRLSPALPEARLELAHAYLAAGMTDRARQVLEENRGWRSVVPLWDRYRLLLDATQSQK